MKTQWIHHKGQKILLADYSNFGFDAAGTRSEMEVAIKLASAEALDSILTLTNVENTKLSPEMYEKMKDTAAKIGPYTRRRAVVGIVGTQRKVLDLINKLPGQSGKQLKLFDDLEAAKNWLVEG